MVLSYANKHSIVSYHFRMMVSSDFRYFIRGNRLVDFRKDCDKPKFYVIPLIFYSRHR